MATKKNVERRVNQAIDILGALGVPLGNLSLRRKTKMAKVFMAVAGLTSTKPWSEALDNASGHRLTSREIITYINKHFREKIADSSYDDIRRNDLALPEAALIVLKSAKNPDANTNDGTRGFALNPAAALAIRHFGTPHWDAAITQFMQGRESLAQELLRERNLARVAVQIGSDVSLTFSPGKHNVLQKQIIESFLAIFGYGAEVLYVGDTADKSLFVNQPQLTALQFFELAHDKLPDVVAYSKSKNWLYLIEAVTSANPITELRRRTLAKLVENCPADAIYVTAFPDRTTYRKFAKDIAWETEVWIADAPEHMIHFNGDKFLGPHK